MDLLKWGTTIVVNLIFIFMGHSSMAQDYSKELACFRALENQFHIEYRGNNHSHSVWIPGIRNIVEHKWIGTSSKQVHGLYVYEEGACTFHRLPKNRKNQTQFIEISTHSGNLHFAYTADSDNEGSDFRLRQLNFGPNFNANLPIISFGERIEESSHEVYDRLLNELTLQVRDVADRLEKNHIQWKDDENAWIQSLAICKRVNSAALRKEVHRALSVIHPSFQNTLEILQEET